MWLRRLPGTRGVRALLPLLGCSISLLHVGSLEPRWEIEALRAWHGAGSAIATEKKSSPHIL